MKKYSIFLLMIFISTYLFSLNSIGKVKILKGSPYILRKIKVDITEKTKLLVGDSVNTGSNSQALILLNEGTKIKVYENSVVKIKKNFIFVKKGSSFFKVKRKGKKVKFFTPTAMVGVYGTEFELNYIEGKSIVKLHSGSVSVQALKGKKEVKRLLPGQIATVFKDGILKISKFKKYKVSFSSGTSNQSEDNAKEEPTQEYIDESYDTEGNLRFIVGISKKDSYDFLKIPFRVLINGYSKLNGKELYSPTKNQILLTGLCEGTYNMSIIFNGIRYDWDFELTKENNCTKEIIYLEEFKFKVYFGKCEIREKIRQEIKNIKVTINYNGISTGPLNVCYDYSGKATENDLIFYGTSHGGNIEIYYPLDYSDFSAKFEYIGKYPVKKKIIQTPVTFPSHKIRLRF